MADRLVIDNLNLSRQIQRIADEERRSVEEVIASMLTQYRPQSLVNETPDGEEMALQVRLDAYQQARDYWEKAGNTERATMTDKQLDEEFWLFDGDGIPRLKADRSDIQLPESSLHQAGQILRSAGFHSGQTDIGAHSREILHDEFPEYLLSRMSQLTDDASDSPASG